MNRKCFLQRAFFGAEDPPCPPPVPDDTEIKQQLAGATNEHKKAAVAVKGAAIRQLTEGNYVRVTLDNVLRGIMGRGPK